MRIDKRSRAELKQYFVKNAIPTESNFAELIDGMLSQRDDGIAKLPNDPLSIEAAGDDAGQKKAIHFYGSFSDANPAWALSLNPRQDPANAATARPGFSISDGDGNSRLFVERTTGNVGVGTIGPLRARLQVAGTVMANRFTSDNALVLNDYTTPNPSSNAYLYSPPNDRDAWLYLDSADTGTNWGIYHRQIDTPVRGLPGNSIGFVGGGSKLQAYIGLADGSAFFAGNTSVGGALTVTGTVQATTGLMVKGNAGLLNIEGTDHAYIQWYPMKGTSGRKGWIGYGAANTTDMAVNNDAGDLYLKGTTVRVSGNLQVENLGWAPQITDFNAKLLTGLYQGPDPVGKPPDASHGWWHLIAIRHSNQGNHHQLQIASSYNENDRLFFRKIARSLDDNVRPGWNEVATVTNGVLKVGEWTIESAGDSLFIKRGASVVARFSTSHDRFLSFQNVNGAPPYFYFNAGGSFGRYP